MNPVPGFLVMLIVCQHSSPLLLTLSTPISGCKFLLLVPIHFVEYPLREFVYTSRQFIFGDHFPNSHDLYVL